LQSAAPHPKHPSRELLRINLVVERARRRFSQTALAEASGLTRQTISDIERGVANPTLDVLDRICAALGIPIGEIFTPNFSGIVDDDELERRLLSGREDSVDARVLLDAIDEANGRPSQRYSDAGRPPVVR
jgi:transcriptional regulator with XRE-family HTH domain